jgi:hypothetical protein
MSHLLLAHLSQDNNRPELVQLLFGQQAGEVRIAVASRYGETEVYMIGGERGKPLEREMRAAGEAVAGAALVSGQPVSRRALAKAAGRAKLTDGPKVVQSSLF